MSYDGDDQQQDRAFSLASLGQLAGGAQGVGGSLTSNPIVNAAVNLQRRHPGEMVFLEVAAAGALLYGHQKRKARAAEVRLTAEEDLKRRGWDGGAALHHQDTLRRQNSGLAPLQSPTQQRPSSAPPSQAWQSNRGGGDDDLAYGDYKGAPPPVPQYQNSAQWDNDLAYGKTYEQQLPFGYVQQIGPPADQQYLPPQGPPPPYNGYPQQQLSPSPYSPNTQYGGMPPPLSHVQSWGPGGQPPQQPFPPYQGPPQQWGGQQQPPPMPGQYGYQAPGPY